MKYIKSSPVILIINLFSFPTLQASLKQKTPFSNPVLSYTILQEESFCISTPNSHTGLMLFAILGYYDLSEETFSDYIEPFELIITLKDKTQEKLQVGQYQCITNKNIDPSQITHIHSKEIHELETLNLEACTFLEKISLPNTVWVNQITLYYTHIKGVKGLDILNVGSFRLKFDDGTKKVMHPIYFQTLLKLYSKAKPYTSQEKNLVYGYFRQANVLAHFCTDLHNLILKYLPPILLQKFVEKSIFQAVQIKSEP